ncbi:SDR family oxidoreductase [Mycobacterium sp. ITM-2016-00318]|uniref:SDR family oxidoreductase n=1 Tax=Mycobacterium sp. ITM-2016-00318 TaxID=2099693 RepID=UPI000CFA07BA|nr:SDR family oxidoreductase [Mycobacterium sp. ITM-2016-00318]WNG91071.1 SDR family oxidoreductase [Mycobacterium sp. ITM-2016-00318]
MGDTIAERFVDSADGVRIAVYEQGNPDGPTLVMAHGWPDSHVLWDGVVPRLADRFRIVRYDNRGVGKSSVPKPISAYTISKLADDLGAVIAATSPGEPVHLLGHDWGSVSAWEYLSRPGAAERVASFTSASGPGISHYGGYIFDSLKRPYRPVQFARAIDRLLRLTYWYPFAAPVLAPAVFRGLMRVRDNKLLTDRVPAGQRFRSDTAAVDLVNSLKIYRSLAVAPPTTFSADRYVSVPVQLVVAAKDPVVRPHGFDDLSRWVPRLWRRDINAGHWSPMSHPQVLAAAVGELVDHLEGRPASRALLRAEVGRKRAAFGDTLVSVTGAGSGIGRETALAFARDGAELIVSDIDEATAKETAAHIVERGGIAHPYVLDVSDAEAVERFAEQVCAEHGVPDIVVNNAGVGQAGEFLDTPADQWERVLDINLGGVVNGCRAFGRRLVERGTGGHIVNVASMAAYSPSKTLNAYCTSKAAVYMFSDCLRAELDDAGVGLTTICPGTTDTNILTNTRFDVPGRSDESVEKRREQLQRSFRLRRHGPDKAAKAIVTAVRKNKPIRPITPEAYLLYGTSRIAPQVMRSTARKKLV